MPKGPSGQKRPADAIGCAIMVGRIATGEADEEVAYASPPRKVRGKAGAAARHEKLSGEERSNIARNAAAKRWQRSENMTESSQLIRSLFGHTKDERKHMNVKFLRGTADDISEQDFEEQAISALVQVDSGMVDGDVSFEEAFKQVAIADFVKAL